MKHSKKQRKQIAEAFKTALALLWDGKGRAPRHGALPFVYICHALDEVDNPAAATAKEIVQTRIGMGPYAALESWLESQGIIVKSLILMQAYRKRWLLSLIEEFSQ